MRWDKCCEQKSTKMKDCGIFWASCSSLLPHSTSFKMIFIIFIQKKWDFDSNMLSSNAKFHSRKLSWNHQLKLSRSRINFLWVARTVVWSIKMLRISIIFFKFIVHIRHGWRLSRRELFIHSTLVCQCKHCMRGNIHIRFYQSLLWIFINTLSAVLNVCRLVVHNQWRRRRRETY